MFGIVRILLQKDHVNGLIACYVVLLQIGKEAQQQPENGMEKQGEVQPGEEEGFRHLRIAYVGF